MTRKDFELLAAALKGAQPVRCTETAVERSQHAHDVGAIADALSRDNPRFDRARFLKAAGVQS